jgi:hypothetical protein
MSYFKLISVAFLLGIFCSIKSFSNDWRFNTVSTTGNVNYRMGEYCSVSLDINGYPYISYFSENSTYWRCLVLAYQDNTGWHKEKVDECSSFYTSMQIDTQNNPCIAYIDVSNNQVKYAKRINNVWKIDIIKTYYRGARGLEMVLDSNGSPHVVFYDSYNDRIKYVNFENGEWHVSTIFNCGGSSTCSITLDNLNRPLVSIYNDDNYNLYLLNFDGYSWKSDIIYNDAGHSSYPSFGNSISYHKESGKIGICFHKTTWNRDEALIYGEKKGSSWDWYAVDNGTRVGYRASFHFDYFGLPHVAYQDGTKNDLKYAYKDENGWHVEAVHSTNYVGGSLDLELNILGEPHICYKNAKGKDHLDYAYPAAYGPQSFNLIYPPNGGWSSNDPFFVWYSPSYRGEGLFNYELLIDGNVAIAEIAATQPFIKPSQSFSDGFHTWQVKAIETLGNEILSSEIWSFRIDNSRPADFSLIFPSNNKWTNERHTSFSWQRSTDAGSLLNKYQIFIDDNLAFDGINPALNSTTINYALNDGTHNWYVKAIDNAGNERASNNTWAVRIDSTGPNNFNLIIPENNSWVGNGAVTFSWGNTTDSGIGLENYFLKFPDLNVSIKVPKDSNTYSLDDESLIHGSHRWYVSATDSLGNFTNSLIRTVKVDLLPPNIFILNEPADSGFVTFPTPTFSWNETEDTNSGLSHYQLWIDNSLNRDNINGTFSAPASPISEGYHSWFICAVDNAGNARKSNTHTVFGEWDLPEPFQLSFPPNGVTLTSDQPVLSWHFALDRGTGVEKYQLFIDGILDQDFVSKKDSLTTTSNVLASDNHSWFVKAIDKAGNERSSDETWEFTINTSNNIAPTISNIPNAMISEKDTLKYKVIANDPNNYDVIRYNDNTELFDIGFFDGMINYIPLPEHSSTENEITIYATDGNLEDSTKFMLTIGNVNHSPKVFSLIDPPNKTNIDTLNPTLKWEKSFDPDVGDKIHYNIRVSIDSLFQNIIYANTTNDTVYYVSSSLDYNQTYFWDVCAVDKDSAFACCGQFYCFTTFLEPTLINMTNLLPKTLSLNQNYPNPFNMSTTIEYLLPGDLESELSIYNMKGELIKNLLNKKQNAGYHKIEWDCKDHLGNSVSSGLYFYQLKTKKKTFTKKMVIVK